MRKADFIMKHFLSILFLFAACSLFARIDGWYMHSVSRDAVTPHYDWLSAYPEKPLRVFYIAPNGYGITNGRPILELAQRMNMDFTVMLGGYGSSEYGDAVVTGTSHAEKEKELNEKLDKEYDVVIFYGSALASMPAEQRHALLERVREGKTGLVLISTGYQDNVYKKLYAEPVVNFPFARQFSEALPLPKNGGNAETLKVQTEQVKRNNALLSRDVFKCYEFEKGRIVRLDLAVPNPDVYFYRDFENRMALIMQAALWAAGQSSGINFIVAGLEDNPVLNGSNNDIALYFNSNDVKGLSAEMRIRDEFNHTVATVPFDKNFRATMPRLPSGSYFADILIRKDGGLFSKAKTVDFGVYRFDVESPLGKMTLGANGFCEKNEVPKGSVSIQKPSDEDLTLRLSMMDLPYRRIWAKKEIPFPAKQRSMSFTFDNSYIPTVSGMLIAELVNSKGESLSRETRQIVFPNRDPGPYLIFSWGGQRTPFESEQLDELFGFTASLHSNTPALNMRTMPGAGHISVGTHKENKNTTDIGWGGTPKYEDNIYNPDVQKKIQEEIRDMMQKSGNAKYGAILYNLGDENGLSYQAGYGPNDLKYFRDMLKQKYKTIETLNKQWDSSYKSFDEVPNTPHAESLEKGNYPAWFDHHEYIERSYADWHSFRAKEIKKYDPKAAVGAEGSDSGDLERTIENLEFWGPYRSPIGSERTRSYGGPKLRIRSSWYGYHDERNDLVAPFILKDLLTGCFSAMGWFTCEYAGGSYSLLSADCRSSFPKFFNDQLTWMRFGLGEAFSTLPLTKSGIMIFDSHLSRRAADISKACVSPDDSMAILINYFYRNGISFDFVSERTLKRLNNKDVSILFLPGTSVISDEAANAIRNFVKNGGTVVADMNPGMFNGYFRKMEKNQLEDLFGSITFDKVQAPKLQPLDLNTKLGNETIRFKASEVSSDPAAAPFQVKEIGKGKVVLLNFTLPTAEVTADSNTPFDMSLITPILASVGEAPVYKADVPTETLIMRVRQGQGYELIGIHGGDSVVRNARKGTLTLPVKKYVYKARVGFAGHTDTVDLEFYKKNAEKPFDQSPLQIYSVFDEPQKAPEFKLPAEVKAGDAVDFDFQFVPEGRFLLIQVFGPDGKEIMKRNVVLNTAKARKHAFHFAFNDPKGTWKFVVSDVLTGLSHDEEMVVK